MLCSTLLFEMAICRKSAMYTSRTFKWTIVWCCRCWSTCTKLRRSLFKWSPPQCDVNGNKLSGDSLKSNWSGKTTKQVASATNADRSNRFPEYERVGTRFPDIELNDGSLYCAVIVWTENKNPSNLFMSFHIFVVPFQPSEFVLSLKGWAKGLIRIRGETELDILAIHS